MLCMQFSHFQYLDKLRFKYPGLIEEDINCLIALHTMYRVRLCLVQNIKWPAQG